MGVIVNSPFKNAVGPASVPKKGAGGTYGSVSNLPGRTASSNAVSELIFDGQGGSPASKPVVNSPFKDAYKK